MIIEKQYEMLPFTEWLADVFPQWIAAIVVLLVCAVCVGFVFSALQHGLFRAFPAMFSGVARGMEDIIYLSWARTYAVARLVIKESLRKRVVIVCFVFLVLLMFASWFLNPNAADPAQLYTSFVLNATCYLVLLMALFLSAFSIPNDIKSKTIYTIVTKPVRASELVLGRILGIGFIGTTILVFMSVVSFLFVSTSLNHTHLLTLKEDMSPVQSAADSEAIDNKNQQRVIYNGDTRLTNNHKHFVEVLANNSVHVKTVNGHTHHISFNDGRFEVAESKGLVQARVPQFGKLLFRGAGDMDDAAGINVGDEWMYRSFIGGGSKGTGEKNKAAAFWSFDNITPARFPENGIPVEMTLGVFRTHKGDIERPVYAKLSVRNPKTGLTIEALVFGTQEFVTKGVTIPSVFKQESTSAEIVQRRTRDTAVGRVIVSPSDEDAAQNKRTLLDRDSYDLFKDIVADGKMEIWLQCLDNQQYVGVGAADLYIRAANASVPLNFIKGFFGIWLQMILVLSFGVLLSTFLSGAVTMIATICVMITGFAKTFLLNIGLGSLQIGDPILGGGPFESYWRIISGKDMMSDLPAGFATALVKSLDTVVGGFLALIGQAIPPLSDFFIYYEAVSKGFDISPAWMLQHGVETMAYLLPIFLVGYLILGNREVAK